MLRKYRAFVQCCKFIKAFCLFRFIPFYFGQRLHLAASSPLSLRNITYSVLNVHFIFLTSREKISCDQGLIISWTKNSSHENEIPLFGNPFYSTKRIVLFPQSTKRISILRYKLYRYIDGWFVYVMKFRKHIAK